MTKESRDGVSGLNGKDGDDKRRPWHEKEDDEWMQCGTCIMPVEEGIAPKALRQPYQPTQMEIEKHELTHIPFRDWCIHCMRGRGQSNQHRSDQCEKSKGEEDKSGSISTFSMDYMFLTVDNALVTEDEAKKMDQKKMHRPVLVGKDRNTGAVVAHVVEAKGRGNGYIVKRIIQDLESLGYGGTRIILKCDQGSAIVEVQKEVMKRRPAITIPANSAVGDSKGNGDAESTVKRIRGQLRTMVDALEAKLKHKIKYDHVIMQWMVEWAAGLVTRYSARTSGKSPYEEIRGKTPGDAIAVFGERILYMPKIDEKQQMRFPSGIFLGMQMLSNETIVGTENGVFKARTVRRVKPDSRWGIEFVNKMVGSVYEPVPGRPGEQITKGANRGIDEDDEREPRPEDKEYEEMINVPINEPKDPVPPRRMYVRKADVERYGATDDAKDAKQ